MSVQRTLSIVGISISVSLIGVAPGQAIDFNPIHAVKNIGKAGGKIISGGAKEVGKIAKGAAKVQRVAAAIPVLAVGGAVKLAGGTRNITKAGEKIMGGSMTGDDPRYVSSPGQPAAVIKRTGKARIATPVAAPVIKRTGKPVYTPDELANRGIGMERRAGTEEKSAIKLNKKADTEAKKGYDMSAQADRDRAKLTMQKAQSDMKAGQNLVAASQRKR